MRCDLAVARPTGRIVKKMQLKKSAGLSGKKRARLQLLGAGHIPGDDLLSQDLSSHYHWRCGVSLPGSEWDRVVPPRSGHQRSILFNQDRDSGDLSYVFLSDFSVSGS